VDLERFSVLTSHQDFIVFLFFLLHSSIYCFLFFSPLTAYFQANFQLSVSCSCRNGKTANFVTIKTCFQSVRLSAPLSVRIDYEPGPTLQAINKVKEGSNNLLPISPLDFIAALECPRDRSKVNRC